MRDLEFLQAIGNSYDDIYPEEFTKEYILMECLAERRGVDTFLVQNRSGEEFIAKCYDKAVWEIGAESVILRSLECPGLPKAVADYENDRMAVTVREYIEGVSLDRYAEENDLSEKEIVRICIELCDILAILHHREEPVIHRDIKPQNIIVRPSGRIVLIDFDIARVYRSGSDTDIRFFGTVAYAPPEQYGFSQTDARTDIYSLGVLLRYLLTGNARENRNVRVYRPLSDIIKKCTAFAPKERFADVSQVKRALLAANPRTRTWIVLRNGVVLLLALGLFTIGAVKV